VPRELHGAWRRRSIRIGDAPPAEPYDVIWIQSEAGFADLRVPRDSISALPVRVFAGTASWDGRCLEWTHLIDIDPARRVGVDVGEIDLDGDVLRERGSQLSADGTATEYVEEYVRASRPTDETRFEEVRHADGSLRGARVTAGEHRLVVVDDHESGGDLVAEYAALSDGEWTPAFAYGSIGPAALALFDSA